MDKIRVCLCEFCVSIMMQDKREIEVLYYMDKADVKKHQCYICNQPSDNLLICNINGKE